MPSLRDTLVERFQSELSDRYAFEREVGHGGMATVYLAKDLKHDRPVAVKVLSPDLTTAAGSERFVREIRIVAKLQHPNILPLIDSGEAAGLAYFVMPFVEGESLREKLALNGAMAPLEAVRIARGVAGGLAYAHGKGVVHRDIKPENLLLSQGVAVITDFGVARAAGSGSITLTGGGSSVGTPAYMSPEQAAGEPNVDGRSDLYALGCVLYEMVAGRPPFTGSTVQKIMSQHLTATPESLAALRPGLSPKLVKTVERCLAKDPADRFPDAGALEEELRVLIATEVLHHATPTAEAPSAPRFLAGPAAESLPSYPPSRRRPALVLGAALAVAAVVGLVFLPRGVRSAASRALNPFRTDAASIVALPLDNFGDASQNHLSEGLTEEIIAQLSRIPGLKVISRTSATAIKGRGLTIPQMARVLDVEHVLEGSVQRSGDRLRVTLQLIEARSDRHLWAETFDRDVSDALRLREEAGRKVTDALLKNVKGLQAPAAPAAPAAAAGGQAGAAFEAYLRGTYCLQRPSPDMLKGALADFGKALEMDPGYAPAYVGLSATRRMGALFGYREMGDPYGAMRQALADSRKAIELDSNLAEAYAERGLVALFSGAPPEVALVDLDRAVEIAPGSGPVRLAHGFGLYRSRKSPEAAEEMERSLKLDPLCPSVRAGGIGLTNLALRRYDVALAHARAATENGDPTGIGLLTEGTALLLLRRLDELEKLDLAPWPELKAMLLASRGRSGDARALLLSLDGDYRAGRYDGHVHAVVLGAAWAWAGDAARAREWVERSFDLAPQGTDVRLVDSGLYDRVREPAGLLPLLEERRKLAWARVSGGLPAAGLRSAR